MNYRRIENPDLQIEASILTKDTSQAEGLCKSQITNQAQDRGLSQGTNLVQGLDPNQARDLLIQDQILNLLLNQARDLITDHQIQGQAADLQIQDQVAGLQIQDQAQDHRQVENLLHDRAICEQDINNKFNI